MNSKPKITSAVYKNRGNSKGSIDVLVDGPLLSDLFVKDYNDPIQEEQIRLGNLPNENQIYFNQNAPRLSKLGSIDTKPFDESVVNGVKIENGNFEGNNSTKS